MHGEMPLVHRGQATPCAAWCAARLQVLNISKHQAPNQGGSVVVMPTQRIRRAPGAAQAYG